MSLTTAERKYLAKYIRQAADAVSLRDWTFEVTGVPCSPLNVAEIELVPGRRIGMLRVSVGFFHEPVEEQHEAIAHELVHCHLHGAAEVMRVDVGRALRKPLHEVLWSSFERNVENAVDAIAPVFMQAFPAPEWKP